MIDESQIEWLQDGERAEAVVLNRPLRQVVRAANAAIGASTDDRFDEIFEIIKDGNGFTREKDAQLIFDAENATVSIAPGLGKSTWFYYHKGRKIESSETLTYTLSEDEKTGGGFYLSFDKDKNLVNTGPHPDFFNTTLCFYVHYSNGEFIIEGDERHSADRDAAWHESHHREDGMVIYTLGDIDWKPNDPDNVGIQITTTLVADEDLHHLISHSQTGEEPFSQILEGSQDEVRIPTLYYDGSIRYLADKKLPWVADALKYNDDTALKDVPNGKFVNYFLVATNCQKYPIKLIMGRKIFDSDHEAVDETLESLGLNFPEMALMYRIVLKRDNSLSTVGKCTITSVQQAASRIIFESAVVGAGSGLFNHAQLLGRTENNAHPVSAITGLQMALDSKVDKVPGKELSANDFTDVLKTKLDSLPSGEDGVIPISGGGTGATTAPDARTALGLGDEAIRWPTFDEVTDKPDQATRWPTFNEVTDKPDQATRWPTFDEVTDKPANYPTTWSIVTDKPAQATRWPTWNEVTDKPDQATRWPTWNEVTDKPTTFTPSSHTHPWSQITGQPATATRWPTFDEVTDKPANYPTTWSSVAAKPAQATRWPTWDEVTNKPLVQTTGNSATSIMSQKAVTDALSSAGSGGTPDKNNILFSDTVKTAVEFDHLSISKHNGHSIPETSVNASTYIFPGGISCKSPVSSGVRTYFHAGGIGINSANSNLVEFTTSGSRHNALFKGTVHTNGGILAEESIGSQSFIWANDGLRVSTTGTSGIKATIDSSGVASFVDVNITSDERYKSNKRKIANPIDKVNALSGYNYTLHSEIGGEVVGESAGILAQDVEKVMPECVIDTDGKLSVSYSGITALLVETVKDMNARIIELEKTIETMRQQ